MQLVRIRFYINSTSVGCSLRAFTIELQFRSPVSGIYINSKLVITVVTHVIPHALVAGPDSKLVDSHKWIGEGNGDVGVEHPVCYVS